MVIHAMPRKSRPHKKHQAQFTVPGFSSQEKLSCIFTEVTCAADSREESHENARGELLWLKFKIERRNRNLATNPWSGW
jgi:hypothetical protein